MSTLHMLVKRPHPPTSHITAVPHQSIDDVTQTFDFEQMRINTDFFTGMRHVSLPREDVGWKQPLWHQGSATEAQTEEVWKGWLALNCFSYMPRHPEDCGWSTLGWPCVQNEHGADAELRQIAELYHLWGANGAWEIPAMATSVRNNNKATRRHQDRGWRVMEAGEK